MTDRSNRIAPIALLGGVLLLAGCGVKGPLEPPVGAENIATPNPLQTTITSDMPRPSVTSTPTQTSSSTSNMSLLRARKEEPKEGSKRRVRQGGVPVTNPPPRPDQPFLLDKLL